MHPRLIQYCSKVGIGYRLHQKFPPKWNRPFKRKKCFRFPGLCFPLQELIFLWILRTIKKYAMFWNVCKNSNSFNQSFRSKFLGLGPFFREKMIFRLILKLIFKITIFGDRIFIYSISEHITKNTQNTYLHLKISSEPVN